jgi:hypothetical protein
MRTILLGDIIAAARALLAAPSDNRIGLLDTMIQQANAAHHFHKRLSRPHPNWGNGSLMARANLEPQMSEPFASDIDYLQTLQLVIAAIICHRGLANPPRKSPLPQ